MARYLDPSRRWDADSEARLRSRLADSEADREEYRRAVVTQRLMLGGDPREPSRVEDDHRLEALLERFAEPGTASAAPTPHPRQATKNPWLAWVGGLVTGLAALTLVVATGLGGADDPTASTWRSTPGYDLTARGSDNDRGPLVGYGVTGVTEDGGEYEVLASGRAFVGDYLRFSYTNDAPAEIGHLFLFGLQYAADGTVAIRWYAPEPGYGETQSAATPAARTRFFDFETKLNVEHTPGELRFVGIFTRDPLKLPTVEDALRDLAPDALSGPETGFETMLRVRLGLPPSTRVQIRDTTVVAQRPTGAR